MNFRVDDHGQPTSISQSHPKTLKQKIQGKYQGFQAPFSERRFLLIAIDTLLVFFAILFAFFIWERRDYPTSSDLVTRVIMFWYWIPILIGGWWVLAFLNDLYDIPSSVQRLVTFSHLMMVGGIALLLYLLIFFVSPVNSMPRIFFLVFLVLVLGFVGVWRSAYIYLFQIIPYEHRVIIAGRGYHGDLIADVLMKKTKSLKYRVVGFIDDVVDLRSTRNLHLPILGGPEEMPSITEKYNVQEIIVAIEGELDVRLFHKLVECQANGVQISLMPDVYAKLNRAVPIELVNPGWVMQVIQGQGLFSRLQLVLKRVVDIGLSFMGIVLLIPFLPIVALAIRLDSPGPIFYQQIRSGRAGRPFYIVKFRTMTADAEKGGESTVGHPG